MAVDGLQVHIGFHLVPVEFAFFVPEGIQHHAPAYAPVQVFGGYHVLVEVVALLHHGAQVEMVGFDAHGEGGRCGELSVAGEVGQRVFLGVHRGAPGAFHSGRGVGAEARGDRGQGEFAEGGGHQSSAGLDSVTRQDRPSVSPSALSTL